MKICFLNHDFGNKTGAGRFCLSLLETMAKIVPEAELVVLTSENCDADTRISCGSTDCGYGKNQQSASSAYHPHHRHYNFLHPNKFRLLSALPKIRKIFKQCDIIHALDGWPYGFIATLCSLGLGKKIIITAIGTGAVQPLYQPFKKQLMIWAYKKADIVTAVSNNTRREILKVIPDLDIKVINHGVDYDKFSIFNFQFSKIQNLKPYILSVGTLKKRKGYQYSIEAFAQIADRFPDLKYVIVGQGPEREALTLEIRNWKLENRIIFFDQVEEDFLMALYKNAELFILLPQDDKKDIEGFGLVFLEAAACGLSVIASRGSSAEDAILNDQNGFLVDSQDPHQVASAMSKILLDRDVKIKLSQQSINFAKSMSWDKVAGNYLALYRL